MGKNHASQYANFGSLLVICKDTIILCKVRNNSLSLWKRKGYMDFIFILIVAIFFISLLYIAIKAIVEWCTKNDFTPMGWH